jgi:hypothetical protein
MNNFANIAWIGPPLGGNCVIADNAPDLREILFYRASVSGARCTVCV